MWDSDADIEIWSLSFRIRKQGKNNQNMIIIWWVNYDDNNVKYQNRL